MEQEESKEADLKYWEKTLHPTRILYLEKLSFESENEIKTFSDKQSLRKYVTHTPALQEMLKGVL